MANFKRCLHHPQKRGSLSANLGSNLCVRPNTNPQHHYDYGYWYYGLPNEATWTFEACVVPKQSAHQELAVQVSSFLLCGDFDW